MIRGKSTMKKYLANIVTSSRIAGAFVLFLCNEFSALYLWVYVYCGFTDLIDGPIARKTNSASVLGAALDTIGDVLTYLSLVKILVIKKAVPVWLLVWLFILIVLWFGLALFAKHKFNKFYLPHTYLGKLLGGSVFVLPLAMQVMDGRIWMALIGTIMTVNLFECVYIQIKSTEAKGFVATVFHINKEHN